MRRSPPVRMNRSGRGQVGQRHARGERGFVDVLGAQPAGGDVAAPATRAACAMSQRPP